MIRPNTLLLSTAVIVAAVCTPAHSQNQTGGQAGYPGSYGFSQPVAGYQGGYGTPGSNGNTGNNGNSGNYGVSPPQQTLPNRTYVQPIPSAVSGYPQRTIQREWQDRDDRANYQRDHQNHHDSYRDSYRDNRQQNWYDRNDQRSNNGGRGNSYGQRNLQDAWRR